jgi:hypothetical protein
MSHMIDPETGPVLMGRPDARFFSFVGTGFWKWIPSTWVRGGTVIMTEEGDFWRLLTGSHDGWWAEPIRAGEVGDERHLARIKAALIAFEAEATDAEARQKLDGLREELIRLCNPRIKDRPEPAIMPDAWWSKGWVAAITGGLFIVSLANAYRTFAQVDPEPRREGYRLLSLMYALAAFILFLLVFVPFLYARYPYKMRRLGFLLGRRFGNVVGIIGLAFLGLIAAVIVWLFIVFSVAPPGTQVP